MASWIDALASRSGPLSNAAKHFAAKHGLECDPPRGIAGLLTLRELMVRHGKHAEDEELERRFVEGAGAYFALVLLDQLGCGTHAEREGAHRLQLGHGAIDPFASVTRVLQAEDVRRALLAEVALAEAEARGEGPIARVVRETERQLADVPGTRLLERWGDKLWVEVAGNRVELDLERIVEVTRGESERTLEGAVKRVCAALRPNAARVELPWEAARDRIFPRLQGPAFLDALPEDRALHLSPLASELWVSLVLKYEERARYVRAEEVEAWSKDGANAMAQSLQNLAAASERARFSRHDTSEGPIVIAHSRDGHDASRLLLPGVHALLRAELGSPCVVAVPHRDTLLAAASATPSAVAELRRRVDEAVRRAPHAISRSLVLLGEDGLMGDAADGGMPSMH